MGAKEEIIIFNLKFLLVSIQYSNWKTLTEVLLVELSEYWENCFRINKNPNILH